MWWIKQKQRRRSRSGYMNSNLRKDRRPTEKNPKWKIDSYHAAQSNSWECNQHSYFKKQYIQTCCKTPCQRFWGRAHQPTRDFNTKETKDTTVFAGVLASWISSRGVHEWSIQRVALSKCTSGGDNSFAIASSLNSSASRYRTDGMPSTQSTWTNPSPYQTMQWPFC